METILATAFGREIAIQKGESSHLTKAAAVFFEDNREDRIISPMCLDMIFSICVIIDHDSFPTMYVIILNRLLPLS